MQEVVEDKLKVALKEVFGFDKYRGNQEAIIKSIYAGNDTFVEFPVSLYDDKCTFVSMPP